MHEELALFGNEMLSYERRRKGGEGRRENNLLAPPGRSTADLGFIASSHLPPITVGEKKVLED